MFHILIATAASLLLVACNDSHMTGSGSRKSAKSSAESTKQENDPSADEAQDSEEELGTKITSEDEEPSKDEALEEDERDWEAGPGTLVAKVGINFDDAYPISPDYNDVVLCFSGSFKVNGSEVLSTVDQTVLAATSSLTGGRCSHEVKGQIVGRDGKSTAFDFISTQTNQIELKFKAGSTLNVQMRSLPGSDPRCMASTGNPVDLHSPTHVKVMLDVCLVEGG